MRTHLPILSILLLLATGSNSQEARFNRITQDDGTNMGRITAIAQDRHGFMWFAALEEGLSRFDGKTVKSFSNDPGNPNSLSNNTSLALYIDKEGKIWVGTMGGLNMLNPETNVFTHFRHDPKNSNSLSNDTVTTIFEDHLGNFWIGTQGGLDLLDRKTGTIKHFLHNAKDNRSLSFRMVWTIYEDRKGELWIGCGSNIVETPGGGLNRLDRTAGKFTRYLRDPSNPAGLEDNNVLSIYEDSRGDFWIGTKSNGLHTMDRNTGLFTHYYYNPANKDKPGGPPRSKKDDGITFITEDATAALWFGSFNSGIQRYDPVAKKNQHYGIVLENDVVLTAKDTALGFTSFNALSAFTSIDGLFWVGTIEGILYNINFFQTSIPFYPIKQQEANTIYAEPNGKIVWIATDNGLLRRDLVTLNEKLYTHDSSDINSLAKNVIYGLRNDKNGKLWIGTWGGGLDLFDPLNEKFIHYKNDTKTPGAAGSNRINFVFMDRANRPWVATDSGIARFDSQAGRFINYSNKREDSTTIMRGNVVSISDDAQGYIWAGASSGISRLDQQTGKFKRYLARKSIRKIFTDSRAVVWAGGPEGLYYYDRESDRFLIFADENSPVGIKAIVGIIEDNNGNLWLSATNKIFRISKDRKTLKVFAEAQGVRHNLMGWVDDFKAVDGKLYLGHWEGYYAFYPENIKEHNNKLQLHISSFKLRDKEVKVSEGGILTAPLLQTKEIRLNFSQNVFSFEFPAIDFVTPGDEKYLFMLENYDDNWHSVGSDHRAFFFNIPPGFYVFRAKVVNSDGASVEKSIAIIISPPWWRTWWAYTLFGLLILSVGYLLFRLQKRRIVHAERMRTQQIELLQAREIEKAYNELRSTQALLIQSEKMASLGELTAGIAHEIQNPLNFINNFSEVNMELIDEMQTEIKAGHLDEAAVLAADIRANQEKVNHHGNRADAIVKGMLQHSRSSSGIREITDLNALADEYLRLAYHGLRAKDKTFNAMMKTDFDPAAGEVVVVRQDIGRVILNLITNAFHAVDEKKKEGVPGYEPYVTVSTRKLNGMMELRVTDNGKGVPPQLVSKIFQPFFTTKPAGQGTGLGLSLSYDIIKAHDGALKVESKENEGSSFIIQFPLT